jgi:hypothetical protein
VINTPIIHPRRRRQVRAVRGALLVVSSALVAAWVVQIVGAVAARADGIGISPAVINYPGTMRGVTYTANLTLSNTSETAANEFVITPIGAVADWVELERRDDSSDASTVVVEPNSDVQVAVLLTVPPTAANGSYTGSLDIVSTEVDVELGAGSGSSVQIGGLVDIAVEVVGDQRRDASVGDMYVEPAEVGMLQRFNAVVENRGNVRVEPLLEIEILRDGEPVELLSSEGTMNPVFPSSSGTTFVEWDTAEQSVGTYQAEFRVLDVAGAQPVELGTAVVDFRLEQLGTFTREGTFDALVVLGAPQVGALTNVEATFTNTGRITSNAVASIEIYLDGELVDTAVSLERSTRPGETAKIVLPVPTREYGDYRLVGTVNYEGLATDPREVTFRLDAPSSGRSWLDWLVIGLIVVGAAAVALGIVAVVLRRRRGTDLPEGRPQSVGAGGQRR